MNQSNFFSITKVENVKDVLIRIKVVRHDRVVRNDLMEHPDVKIILDTLETIGLRVELATLLGNDASVTGEVTSAVREKLWFIFYRQIVINTGRICED